MPDRNRAVPARATGFRPVYDPDMVRLGGRAEVAAIDARPFLAALPELLAGWRALVFVDGVVRHPVTGRLHGGLRVVDGRHPLPGVAYRLLLREDEVPAPTAEEAAVAARLVHADAVAATEWERGRVAAARATGRVATTWHTYVIRLEADERERTCFTVHHDGTDTRARVEVSPGPIEVLLDVPGWLGARGLLGGVVTVRMRADPSRLPPYGDEEPQLVATVTHPRGRADAELAVAPVGSGRWLVTTRASARGVGWLRPFAGLLAPFVKRPAQRGLDGFLAGLPEWLDRLNGEIAARYPAPPDPHAVAGQVLADLISAVPANIPAAA
jgi:hypothetical protein